MSDASAAPPPAPIVDPSALKEIAPDVYVIGDRRVPLVPNIGIILGRDAALVVDTGMGPANGEKVLAIAKRLAGARRLILTLTHFHPEHAAGEAGFPQRTILIRNSVQQQEMDMHGKEMVDMFAGRSAQQKELLANATLRAPDITFASEAKLDLGSVTARLLWFGGAHTKGDELTFVEPDRTKATREPKDCAADRDYRRSTPFPRRFGAAPA